MIHRTYMCEFCGHRLEVELRSDQWQEGPPDCPQCASTPTVQVFHPPAIVGGHSARAHAIAETIAAEDYNVADLRSPSRSGPSVRYKDAPAADILPPSSWTAGHPQMAQALALGRETRLRHGNGLDVLQGALKSGAQRDLIADSRQRSMKVW